MVPECRSGGSLPHSGDTGLALPCLVQQNDDSQKIAMDQISTSQVFTVQSALIQGQSVQFGVAGKMHATVTAV